MRILILAHRIPYPPHTGDKTRAFHIARYLARRHDVTLAFLVDERTDLLGIAPLREMVPVMECGRLWKPWSVLKGLAGLAGGASISHFYFRSRGLRRRLARRASEGGYDLVYASSTPMAQYARALGVPVAMDFVDVDSDKWAQYAERSRAPMSWLYRAEGRRLRAYEADIARWAQLSLLATPAEEALLKSFAPWARTGVIPNGIDLEFYRPLDREARPPALIFTGAMDYLPNIDAVRYFCEDILPLIRRAVAETRFFIVGLKPPAAVQRLASSTGVVVTGAVPDVRPYYGRASVCVAPLRMGRGVQNKVLQAMAMGMPVVTTSVGHRGLEAQVGRHLHVEDVPSAFAARVVELLRSAESRLVMGSHARAFVEAHHAWGTSCARLEAMLMSITRLDPDSLRAPA